MGKPYSMDLRERVVAAVDRGGLSCHKAAAQFGVGVNTAILWVRRFRWPVEKAGDRLWASGPRSSGHSEIRRACCRATRDCSPSANS
jgi:putative transposase